MARCGRLTDVGIREAGFAAGHEVLQGFVDGGINRRWLVLGELFFVKGVGALGLILFAVFFPLLVAIAVRYRGAVEGFAEVLLGVGAAEKVLAWADFGDGVHGLAVVGEIDAVEKDGGHAGLVAVHNKFFVADH